MKKVIRGIKNYNDTKIKRLRFIWEISQIKLDES